VAWKWALEGLPTSYGVPHYEAVKEQRYAVSRSRTKKREEKREKNNPTKPQKRNSRVAKESPHTRTKSNNSSGKERKKETKEGRKEACATMDLDLVVDDPR
jgi:hypothetical protein